MITQNEFQEMERTALALADGAEPEERNILETMAKDFRSRGAVAPYVQPQIGMKIFWVTIGAMLAMYFLMAWHFSHLNIQFIPTGKIVVHLVRPFYREGNALVVPPHMSDHFNQFGDDPKIEGDKTSPLILYEDGTMLGPAHSTFFDIHQLGGGHYAHWKGRGIAFSSSDNTDPNTNGRKYWAVIP
jgi:hypothetical protein